MCSRSWERSIVVAIEILHTGTRVYRLGDRIQAAPISTLWV